MSMANQEPSTDPGPSTQPTARSSTRTRVKSQRAIESEHAERLFKKGSAPVEDAGVATDQDGLKKPTAPKRKKTAIAAARGKKGKAVETYCICESDGEDGRPMIECGTCNDWFHFDCLGLSVDEAERIHEFVCPSCEEETGKKTSHTYDLSVFPSPSPPPGFVVPAKRGSKKGKQAAKISSTKVKPSSPTSVHTVNSSSSDDEGSVVESASESSSSSDSASDAAESRPLKKKIKQLTHRPVNVVDGRLEIGDRKPVGEAKFYSKSRKPGGGASSSKKVPAGALPPARAFVLMKLGQAIKGLFKDESQAEIDVYARELEAAVWDGFKEVINGKDTAGSKYKAQYSLLARSLTPELRQDTLTAILSRSLSPDQVANLTNTELASAARLAEMEAAKQASLASLVKPKDEQADTIRLGRDGFEKAEDAREKEMNAIQASEEAARARQREQERRASMLAEGIEVDDQQEGEMRSRSPSMDNEQRDRKSVSQSPAVTSTPRLGSRPGLTGKGSTAGTSAPGNGAGSSQSPMKRQSVSESPKDPSFPRVRPPVRQVSLTSAWGSGDGKADQAQQGDLDLGLGLGQGDQSQLDLSDIVMEEEEGDSLSAEVGDDVGTGVKEGEGEPKSAWEAFEALPTVWSGGIINPAKASPHTPPIIIRHISSRSDPPAWSALLPTKTLEISGRVPTASSTQYLESSRMTPTKELIVVSLTLDPTATEDQRVVWDEMVDFHIQKDRHALVHPYGNGRDARPVLPGGAKELYLIPLRASDSSPTFTDLIDGYSLPSQSERKQSVFVGVFIAPRLPTPTPTPAAQVPSVSAVSLPPNTYAATVPAPNPAAVAPSHPSSAFESQKLQALMASLNPQAIQGALGGLTPPNPTPPQGSSTPQPPYVGAPPPPQSQSTPYYSGPPGPPGPPAHGYGYPPPNLGNSLYSDYGPGGQYRHDDYRSPYPDNDHRGGGWDHARDNGERREYGRDQGRIGRGGGGHGGGRGDHREWERERDNGWGSRGGHR